VGVVKEKTFQFYDYLLFIYQHNQCRPGEQGIWVWKLLLIILISMINRCIEIHFFTFKGTKATGNVF